MGRLRKWYHAHKKQWGGCYELLGKWSGINGDTIRGRCWRCSTLIFPNPFFVTTENGTVKTRRRDGSVPMTGPARPFVHLSTCEATDQLSSRAIQPIMWQSGSLKGKSKLIIWADLCEYPGKRRRNLPRDPSCLKTEHLGPALGRGGRLSPGQVETDAMVSLLRDKEFWTVQPFALSHLYKASQSKPEPSHSHSLTWQNHINRHPVHVHTSIHT